MSSNITNALAHSAPWLFAIVVKGTILLLITTAAAQLLRNRSAALRHLLHSAAMASLLLLPVAALLLPSLRLALLPATAAPVQSTPTATPQMYAPHARSAPKPAKSGVVTPSHERMIPRLEVTEEPVTSAQRAPESSSLLAQG